MSLSKSLLKFKFYNYLLLFYLKNLSFIRNQEEIINNLLKINYFSLVFYKERVKIFLIFNFNHVNSLIKS